MIVVHAKPQQCDANDPSDNRGGKRPLINGNAEKLENHEAERRIQKVSRSSIAALATCSNFGKESHVLGRGE